MTRFVVVAFVLSSFGCASTNGDSPPRPTRELTADLRILWDAPPPIRARTPTRALSDVEKERLRQFEADLQELRAANALDAAHDALTQAVILLRASEPELANEVDAIVKSVDRVNDAIDPFESHREP